MGTIIKQHDTWPYLEFAIKDSLDQPVDCRIFTVKLIVRDKDKAVVIEETVGALGANAVWTNEAAGLGEYHWQAADTAVVGLYEYEFEFTRISDGKIFTVPNGSYLNYTVYADIK